MIDSTLSPYLTSSYGPCRANRLNIALATILAAVSILRSSLAMSSEDDQTDMLITAPETSAATKYTVELKPLPTMMSLLPGGFGAGGEFEAKLSDHVAVFVGLTHMRLRLTDAVVDDLRDDQGDETESIPRLTTATRVDAGGRWYGNAHRDSWFLGAKFGAGTTHVDWIYADDRLADDRFAWITEADLGYRWLWDSGLTVRVGIGMGASVTTRREVAALTDSGERIEGSAARSGTYDDARKDIDDRFGGDDGGTAFLTAFDLGVGYSF